MSPNPDRGIVQDREKPRFDLLHGRQSSSYNFQFGYGQLGESTSREVDRDADSDFEAPIPKSSGATKRKHLFKFRHKRSDSALDGDKLRTPIFSLRRFFLDHCLGIRANDTTCCI